MFSPLDDAELFPLLTDKGAALLKRLREHPHAPAYNWRTGDRLTKEHLSNVRAYATELELNRHGYAFGQQPAWLRDFVARCRRDVPYHRARPDWTDDFFALPRMTRDLIRARPWDLVPDSLPLDDLIVYTTSGTTGQALKVISHPEVPSRYLPLMQLMLARAGVTLQGGDRVSIVQVSAQLKTNVMSSVSAYLNGAGFAKVNLLPHDWRHPLDPVHFLDDCAPEIYTGDPFAFAELMKLPLRHQPKALISAGTTLLPGVRAQLARHFACPVIDMYSMNESGPIAFSIGNPQSAIGSHEVLPHNLYVEILDAHTAPCPPGVVGEITLTGGINPYLPLLRYRTGDFAALDFSHPIPRLINFQGRPPVVFVTAAGQRLNAIDVTTALRDLALPWFALHQHADASLTLRAACDPATLAAARDRIASLLGQTITTDLAATAPHAGKPIHYASELAATSAPPR